MLRGKIGGISRALIFLLNLAFFVVEAYISDKMLIFLLGSHKKRDEVFYQITENDGFADAGACYLLSG